jgi:thioredoxin 1
MNSKENNMKLLHFTAEWCGPCKAIKPIVDEVVKEAGDLGYLSVDIDVDSELAETYSVRFVPTFILLDDNGLVLAQVRGAFTKQLLIDSLGI